jgi:archaellum biogenesis protein FlaJ (TadC family)
MENKLKAYVNNLFRNAPATAKAYEVKEEILQNLKDKYNDLVTEGKSKDEAYKTAIDSIGDLSELFAELEKEITPDDSKRQKYLALRSVVAMIFVLAAVPLVMALSYKSVLINVMIAVILVAIGIILAIYNRTNKPGYRHSSTQTDRMAEIERKRSIRKSVSGFLWLITLIMYFIVSFQTNAWHLTWLIFLLAAAIETILDIWLGKAK